jgi:mono/diheme cytochrome c family protein
MKLKPNLLPQSGTALTLVTLFSILVFFGFSLNASAQANAVPTDPAVIAAGEKLYKQNCVACHRVDQKLIGPALGNIYDRREIPWILAFVKNSQKVIASGDDYAVNLFEEYNKTVMTSFDFSDEEILSIVAFVKDQTDNPPQAAVEPGVASEGGTAEPGVPAKYLNIIFIGLVITLILLLVVLVMVVSVLQRYLSQKDDLDEHDKDLVSERFDFVGLLTNKATLGIIAFVVTAISFKGLIDQLYNIGVQQGYAPKQPIAFSHKVHAGQFEIDCNYCHTGVTKSKNANIPSPNICMNCHSAITKGTNTGTAEIEKIYAAVENGEPIEWVRIHNLPDLAYFNHSQHVEVGKVECKTCHGPIEEMEVVEQYSNLTMGWCIECHRTTDIKSKDNAYYDDLVKLHDQMSSESMKVEDIGGLECAKCHY